MDAQSKEGVYGGVCEYELICKASNIRPQPFPPCVHTSWGPGDSAGKYNLQPLQKGAIFSTVNGLAEVRFGAPKEMMRFTVKLKSNTEDEKALSGYVMHRMVNKVAVFTINAPSRGEYGLEIYANDPDVDGNSLYHAFQYLILCNENVSKVHPLPALPSGYLGPQPMFKKLGLSTLSHKDPYVQADEDECQISLGLSQALRVTSQLIRCSNNDDISDYVLQQSTNNGVGLFVRFPGPGLYKFQIYALPYNDSSENLPGVFNYLINCRSSRGTLPPFPKQYGQWKEGCYLHTPLNGVLKASNHKFLVSVPKAHSVAVVVGEDWKQLEKNAAGDWEGDVNVGKHQGKVALCANLTSAKASYSTLLEYTL